MIRESFLLDPSVVFLNHGSFGACPKRVLEFQAEIRARMERQPVRFFDADLPGLLADAREALADFVDAPAEEMAFVTNATVGVNTVLRSLRFEPKDEILITDHIYPSCLNTVRMVASKSGANVRVARVPFPVASEDAVVDAILSEVSDQTKLALLDHITSPTALVFPVAKLVEVLQSRGVDVLIDGAHAPGMLDLSLRELNAAYYTGNCHKWLCAPKGAAFLHVRADRWDAIHPVVTSRKAPEGTRSLERIRLEFDWVGTHDPSAFLSIPAALAEMARLGGDWGSVRKSNHALAVRAREILLDALGLDAPCPASMLGSMAAIISQDPSETGPIELMEPHPLRERLLERASIEVPVFRWRDRSTRIARVSAQLYNQEDEYRTLAQAIIEAERTK